MQSATNRSNRFLEIGERMSTVGAFHVQRANKIYTSANYCYTSLWDSSQSRRILWTCSRGKRPTGLVHQYYLFLTVHPSFVQCQHPFKMWYSRCKLRNKTGVTIAQKMWRNIFGSQEKRCLLGVGMSGLWKTSKKAKSSRFSNELCLVKYWQVKLVTFGNF